MNNMNNLALQQRKRLTTTAKKWLGNSYRPNSLYPQRDTKFYLGEKYIPYDSSIETEDSSNNKLYNEIMSNPNPDYSLDDNKSKNTEKTFSNNPLSINPKPTQNMWNKLSNQNSENEFQNKCVDFGTQETINTNPYFKNNNTNINSLNDLSSYDNHLSERERRAAIVNDQPLRLKLAPSTDTEVIWPSYTFPDVGKSYVNKYNGLIENAAVKYNIDPDLLKATMFTEMSTGHKFGLNNLADILHLSGSQIPMNINGKLWGNIGNRHYNTYEPDQNIEAAANLLKHLQQAVPNPNDYAAIGSLWHNLSTDKLDYIGLRIHDAYMRKLWEKSAISTTLPNNIYRFHKNNLYGDLY